MSLLVSAYGFRDARDEREARAGVEDAITGQAGAWEVTVLWEEQFEAYALRIRRDGVPLVSPTGDDWMTSRLPQSYVESVVPQDGRSQLRQAIFDKVRMLAHGPSDDAA